VYQLIGTVCRSAKLELSARAICTVKGIITLKQCFKIDRLGHVTYFFPTLSELIEACVEKFAALELIDNLWVARTKGAVELSMNGWTPEEAVIMARAK
jgi:hypothetical protein